MTKPKSEALVLSIATPLQVGIYKNNKLVEVFSQDGLTSEVLPVLFEDIMAKYDIDTILYINGPGSYMAIKVCYIFLTTLCILKDWTMLSCSGFEFNQNTPIKAINNRYFHKIDDKIVLKPLDNSSNINQFKLPSNLNHINISIDTKPNFVLPVV
jgi:hypothetical protein